MTNWIDITQPLSKDLASWPGDRAFSYSLSYTKEQTGSVNIGEIKMSVHNGTHADAPFHYDSKGKTIDELPVDLYIGKALVADVSEYEIIGEHALYGLDLTNVKRLLLKTDLPNKPNHFPEEMPIIEPGLAMHLASQGIQLFGIDSPSVDHIESKELSVHHALYNQGIFILENLMLDHVQPGLYDMIALPLKIIGADGSPVRAVIRPIQRSVSDEQG